MCRKCLVQPMPDRGTTALETGSYLLNYAGCGQCGVLGPIKIIDKVAEDSETHESVVYKHTCPECSHVICEHKWDFKIKNGYQKFDMECQLCGYAQDKRSIEPDDPREMAKYDMY